ncbi:flavin reductase family protein [Frankia sp. Cr2]|uniref:flavin reductase family protein n=1 Tax=Frankia sp. Cr2 TaxID=3073932 RepID=UPI002AD4CCA0|nr:flavin reductase family protein [Frankia sp. Cr2]
MTTITVPEPRPLAAGDLPASPEQARQLFRSVFAQLAAGVTVLATVTPAGPSGMTASAVTSLSLDPLLVLACVGNRSATLVEICQAGRFSINMLDATGVELATGFAAQPSADRFTDVSHQIVHEVPVLDDALAWTTCTVHALHPGGDHTILVGSVIGLYRGHGRPLLWHDGRFQSISPGRQDCEDPDM